jgi:hypothetical protein
MLELGLLTKSPGNLMCAIRVGLEQATERLLVNFTEGRFYIVMSIAAIAFADSVDTEKFVLATGDQTKTQQGDEEDMLPFFRFQPLYASGLPESAFRKSGFRAISPQMPIASKLTLEPRSGTGAEPPLATL